MKKVRNSVAVAMNRRYGSVNTVMKDRRLSRPDDYRNSWEAEAEDEVDDTPILPCHPDACQTCFGLDWDIVNDVPCRDNSWCQDYVADSSGVGWHVCGLEKNHKGKHKSGSVEWE